MEENPALETADETHDESDTEIADEFESGEEEDFESEGSRINMIILTSATM